MKDKVFPELQHKKFEQLWYDGFKWEDCNHEQLIDQYRDKDIYSLILVSDTLNMTTYENPEKVRKEPNTLAPHIFEYIMRDMESSYVSQKQLDQIEAKIKIYYPGLKEKDPKQYWQEFDYYVECYRQSLIPQAERELMKSWAINKIMDIGELEDEEEFEERHFEFIKSRYPVEYEEARQELYYPRYTHKYYPKFEIFPRPISLLEESAYINQFFMIDMGEEVKCVIGRGSGSGTRFNHGLFAHLFAALINEGKPCKTIICKIDSNFDLQILREENNLVLYAHHLTGNYPIDSKKSSELLKDIELLYKFNAHNSDFFEGES
jgi:hypothetical protein